MYQTSKRKNWKLKGLWKVQKDLLELAQEDFGLFYSDSSVFNWWPAFLFKGAYCLRTLCGNELTQGHRWNLVNSDLHIHIAKKEKKSKNDDLIKVIKNIWQLGIARKVQGESGNGPAHAICNFTELDIKNFLNYFLTNCSWDYFSWMHEVMQFPSSSYRCPEE